MGNNQLYDLYNHLSEKYDTAVLSINNDKYDIFQRYKAQTFLHSYKPGESTIAFAITDRDTNKTIILVSENV